MKSSNKILTITVVLLLLTNIALVVMLVTGGGKKSGRPNGREEAFNMMVKELGMSDEQQKEYKALKEEHFKESKPLFDSLRAARDAFFALVKDSAVSDSLVEVYSRRVGEKQYEVDKAAFTHFKKVRKIFTAEQKPRFDQFVQKMIQRKRDSMRDKAK